SRSEFKGRGNTSPIFTTPLINPADMDQSLGFLLNVSEINATNSFVDRASSSAKLYTPDCTSTCTSICSTRQLRLSMLRKERWLWNAAKGQGMPFSTTLYNRFKFPLLPGPWIIQGRIIKSRLPSGNVFSSKYCSAS